MNTFHIPPLLYIKKKYDLYTCKEVTFCFSCGTSNWYGPVLTTASVECEDWTSVETCVWFEFEIVRPMPYWFGFIPCKSWLCVTNWKLPSAGFCWASRNLTVLSNDKSLIWTWKDNFHDHENSTSDLKGCSLFENHCSKIFTIYSI